MTTDELDVDDAVRYAAAVGAPVAALGGGFMISRQAKEMNRDLGLRGRQGYVCGRGSVLGDVDADVVTSTFGFWPSDVIRAGWEGGRAVVSLEQAREAYTRACQDWGRMHYAALAEPDAGRLAELLSWVVDSADVAGLPLFAGWRAVELPDDPRARVSQLLHVHREQRGGLHLLAVLASGLTPLQAVLAWVGGTGNATFYGWEEPFEDASMHVAARAAAETLTDRLIAPAYDVLSHDERRELLDLLGLAATAAHEPV